MIRPAAALINELTDRQITLEARGDRLRYRPRSAVPPELMERMKAHKVEILAILRARISDTGDTFTCDARNNRNAIFFMVIEFT